MAGIAISGLSAASALTGVETFAGVQSSTTVKVTASQIISRGMLHPGYVSGRYYYGQGSNPNAIALSANVLYTSQMAIAKRETWTKIGIRVTSGVAGNARLGIYACSDGVPTSLVLDAGTVDVTSTGAKEVTISQVIEPGYYFLGVVSDVAPTINWYVPGVPQGVWEAGSPADNTADASAEFLQYRAFTYGALPNPFSTATFSGLPARPLIWLRKGV